MNKANLDRRDSVLQTLGTKCEWIEPNMSRTYIPAMSFESYGNLGETIRPWSLLKLFDSGELLSKNIWPIYDEWPRDQVAMYSFGVRVDVDPSFYKIDTPKLPLILDQWIEYAKKSSWSWRYELRHPDRDIPYAVNRHVAVRVDKDTKRPVPFPSGWKDRFKFASTGPRLEYVIPNKPSAGVTSTIQKVNYSDTDENLHTNYASYVKYCYDSLAENALLMKYGTGVEQLLKNGMKTLQISFVKETLLGDMLDVESWQDASDKNTFHFEVKKGNDVIVRVTLTFFDLKQATSSGQDSKL